MSFSTYSIIAAATNVISLVVLLALFVAASLRIKNYGTPAAILAGALAIFGLLHLTSFVVPMIGSNFASPDAMVVIYAMNAVLHLILNSLATIMIFFAVFAKRNVQWPSSDDLGRSEHRSENPYQP